MERTKMKTLLRRIVEKINNINHAREIGSIVTSGSLLKTPEDSLAPLGRNKCLVLKAEVIDPVNATSEKRSFHIPFLEEDDPYKAYKVISPYHLPRVTKDRQGAMTPEDKVKLDNLPEELPLASESENGLMSAEDKKKLDGLSESSGSSGSGSSGSSLIQALGSTIISAGSSSAYYQASVHFTVNQGETPEPLIIQAYATYEYDNGMSVVDILIPLTWETTVYTTEQADGTTKYSYYVSLKANEPVTNEATVTLYSNYALSFLSM